VLDRDDFGATLPDREQRIDLLQVAVDSVRAREGVQEAAAGAASERGQHRGQP
jgi:hypothetical protein